VNLVVKNIFDTAYYGSQANSGYQAHYQVFIFLYSFTGKSIKVAGLMQYLSNIYNLFVL
jgi:hypothetical protein